MARDGRRGRRHGRERRGPYDGDGERTVLRRVARVAVRTGLDPDRLAADGDLFEALELELDARDRDWGVTEQLLGLIAQISQEHRREALAAHGAQDLPASVRLQLPGMAPPPKQDLVERDPTRIAAFFGSSRR